MMGEERWEHLLDYVEHKHGTRMLCCGYHTQGKGAVLYVRNMIGVKLGPVGDVEALANKWRPLCSPKPKLKVLSIDDLLEDEE